MIQITLTLDLTPETINLLQMLMDKAGVPFEQMTLGDLPQPEVKPILKSSAKSEQKPAKPKTDAKPKAEEPTSKTNAGTAVSLTDIRALALKFSKSGKQAVLKEIFANYGAAKLSDVPQENYAELLADLEAASNE